MEAGRQGQRVMVKYPGKMDQGSSEAAPLIHFPGNFSTMSLEDVDAGQFAKPARIPPERTNPTLSLPPERSQHANHGH